jgi:CheY-like chemotaxis protein
MPKKLNTILIVDDEENIRCLLRTMLSEDNTVIEAEDGEMAILKALRHKPDLILMDIMMPKVDGYTACNKIRTNPSMKAIPIVMLTALGFNLNLELGYQMGADGYMTKPFTEQALQDTLDSFLKGRH